MIYKLRELKGVDELGGTMRLGAYPCKLAEGSVAREAYGEAEISERHRHRYEFNREYEATFKEHGLRLAGETPDGVYVEICELPDHPWYLGCQFHPEFKSKPLEPHPLFRSFIGAALAHRKRRMEPGAPNVDPPREAARTDEAPRAKARWLRNRESHRHSGERRHLHRRQACPLALIAGPCVIESEEHVHFLAREIRKLAGQFIFKASFDKANRSSVSSYRGPGLTEGLRILKGVHDAGFPVLTDIHEPSQAAPAAEVADILQIPAFLCRQTDLLVEAGRTGRIVNIKKGQFVAPHDIRYAAEKVASTGNRRILITERGSTFGYNNLVVDMRGIAIMRKDGWPVVFDATHSVHLPGAAGTASEWQPEFIAPLAKAAVAAGAHAVFLEVHEAPERALSDGANALRLDLLGPLWRTLQRVRQSGKGRAKSGAALCSEAHVK